MNRSNIWTLLKNSRLKSASKTQNVFLLFLLSSLVVFIVMFKTLSIKRSSAATNDFEWLRNRNFLSRYVRPEEETAIFVPKAFSDTKDWKLIACFVTSAPKNVVARNAIRQTWGKLIKPVFVIGNNDNETLSFLAEEALEFNDLIVEDFVDNYSNLTIKTAFALKHFLAHFKDSTYFFKIDDDVFLNVEALHKLLEVAPQDALIGKTELNAKPRTNSEEKCFVPKFLFDDEFFPPYLNGPAYLIPGLYGEGTTVFS